jgi:hypothetical protein
MTGKVMQGFEIVFDGELMPGAEMAQVKANLARLFQVEGPRVDALFTGRRVLKTGLDEMSAEKYRLALAKAGARVSVRALDIQIEEVELAPPPSPPENTGVNRLRVVPRDEYMAAFASVEAPDFGLAPAGSDLQDQKPQSAPPALDLSGLSVAPVGADLGQAKADVAPVLPDLSHLKLI